MESPLFRNRSGALCPACFKKKSSGRNDRLHCFVASMLSTVASCGGEGRRYLLFQSQPFCITNLKSRSEDLAHDVPLPLCHALRLDQGTPTIIKTTMFSYLDEPSDLHLSTLLSSKHTRDSKWPHTSSRI